MATAAVLLKLLPRRRNSIIGQNGQLNMETPNARAAAQRDCAESDAQNITKVAAAAAAATPSSEQTAVVDDDVGAAKKIQRVWRGHVLRKELSRIIETRLSGKAVQQSLDLVLDWYDGWIVQLTTLALLALSMVTAYFQVFGQLPSAFDSDSSFMTRMSNFDRTSIVDSTGLYPLIHSMIDDFSNRVQVDNINPQCSEALHTLCPFNQSLMEDLYNNSMRQLRADISSFCPGISTNSGYVDNSRRIIGTVYVTQTRRKTTPCAERMLELDPYRGMSRPCLSSDEEDLQFNPPPPASCRTCYQFQLDPLHNLYALAFSGSAFNLPDDFTKCRVDELQSRQWLDARSKNVCILATLMDMQQSGRLLAYSECFFFGDGGKVGDVIQATSVSLFANGYTVSLSLTIVSIICLVVHQGSVVWRTCRANKRELLSASYVLVLGAACVEITAHGLYLSHVVIALGFNFTSQVEDDMIFVDRLGFLDDFNRILFIADDWRVFTFVCAIGLLLLLLNAVVCLEFHPSSAIVGGVLYQAAPSLLSFLFVYAVFLLVYAFIGMILFSRTSLRFATYGSAINALLMLAVGEIEEFEANVSDPTHTSRAASFQYIYFWLYIAVMTILLMNILLAIIVGAFVEMSERANRGSPMLSLGRSLCESLHIMFVGFARRLRRWFGCGDGGGVAKADVEAHEDDNGDEDGDEEDGALMTPHERLLRIRKRYRLEGVSAITLRAELTRVFYSTKSTELVINRCRALTNYETFQSKLLYLRGMDANSSVVKGHTIGLLEAIEERQHELLTGQHHLQTEQKQIRRALQALGVVTNNVGPAGSNSSGQSSGTSLGTFSPPPAAVHPPPPSVSAAAAAFAQAGSPRDKPSVSEI